MKGVLAPRICIPARCFVYKCTILLRTDRELDEVWRQAERVLQTQEGDCPADGETGVFWSRFTVQVAQAHPWPLVLISVTVKRNDTGIELTWQANYGVYGWFAVVSLLLLFGPLLATTPSIGVAVKVAGFALYCGVPLLLFRMNFAGFVRRLRPT